MRTVILPGLGNENTVREVSRVITDSCIYTLIPYRHFGVRPEGVRVYGKKAPSRQEMEELKLLALTEGAVHVRLGDLGGSET